MLYNLSDGRKPKQHVFIFKDLFIWKEELQRERRRDMDGEREILDPLVQSPNGYKNEGCPRMNQRARRSIMMSPVGSRKPSTWGIFCCFPRPLKRSWIRNRKTGA